LIFLVALTWFTGILSNHIEMGPGNSDVIEYNIITPLAATLIVLILFRVFSLITFRSSIGMKLNKIEFDANGIELIKYDKGLYAFLFVLILISMQFNFGSHCCGIIDITEMLISLILFVLWMGSLAFTLVIYKKRNEKIKIKQV